jgi:hypothetical protein
MKKISLVMAAAAVAALLAAPASGWPHGRHLAKPAGSAHSADNRGDVWLDNVGQPAGPGHEMDPHLACADINLWGAKMALGSGAYTIDGWPPSGTMKVAYTSTWHYDTAKGGTQVLDVIDVHKLIANAVANGDKPQAQQGFHFKLQLTQDPQKHKVFWVNCPAPATGTSGGGGGTTTTTTTTTTPAPSGSAPTTTATTTTPQAGVKGEQVTSKAHKNKKRSRRARRPVRQRGFTG